MLRIKEALKNWPLSLGPLTTCTVKPFPCFWGIWKWQAVQILRFKRYQQKVPLTVKERHFTDETLGIGLTIIYFQHTLSFLIMSLGWSMSQKQTKGFTVHQGSGDFIRGQQG